MAEVTFSAPESGPNAPVIENPVTQEPSLEGVPENIAKSYKDQRAEITRLQQELARYKKGEQSETPPAEQNTPPADQPPKAEGEEKKADEASQEDDPAKKVVEAAGLDVAPYQTEFETTGDVAAENRAKIAEGLKGVLGENALDVVNDYIEGRKLLIQNERSLFMKEAGGEEQYNTMVQWAAQNMPKDQIEAYNRQVNSGDRHATMFAIQSLKVSYERANGKTPNLVTGGAGPVNTTSGYASVAEMRKDMADPRYKTDPAFRDRVKARLAASNV